ncbi:MAG: hypothetical protein ACI3XS_05120 [Eubacteriales bacterium]
MKIDKKMINLLLKLNDDQLWNTLMKAASKSGADGVKNVERPADMSKIRAALSSLTDEDISRAAELFGKGNKHE